MKKIANNQKAQSILDEADASNNILYIAQQSINNMIEGLLNNDIKGYTKQERIIIIKFLENIKKDYGEKINFNNLLIKHYIKK